MESLKKSGSFGNDAQTNALTYAKTEVLKELNKEAREFITLNYGDIQIFITNQIEATINLLKN